MKLSLEFWGSQGRLGRIGAGPSKEGYVFAYPDTRPEWWTIVVTPAPDGYGEDFIWGNDVAASVLESMQVEWLEKDDHERELEAEFFERRPLLGPVNWLPGGRDIADADTTWETMTEQRSEGSSIRRLAVMSRWRVVLVVLSTLIWIVGLACISAYPLVTVALVIPSLALTYLTYRVDRAVQKAGGESIWRKRSASARPRR